METAIQNTVYSYQQYLALEKETNIRHEYWNGEVFAMAGGTKNHNKIGLNISTILSNQFGHKGCETFFNDVKLQLQKENYYVYPDVLLTCDKEDNDAYVVTKPSLIVEVLSASTENYDRSIKLAQYRKIPTLRYYLLVSQKEPFVEVYGRTDDEAIFTYEVYENMEDSINLSALSCNIPLADVYKYVTFMPE